MEIIKKFKEHSVKFTGTRYFNTMVNIIDLSKINKKDPFEFLQSEETQGYFDVLKKHTHYKEVIDGVAIPKKTRAYKEKEVLFIEGSQEVYVHIMLGINFVGLEKDLYCWFMDAQMEAKFAIEEKYLYTA